MQRERAFARFAWGVALAGSVACRKTPAPTNADAAPAPAAAAAVASAAGRAASDAGVGEAPAASGGVGATYVDAPLEDPFASMPRPRVEAPFRGTAVDLAVGNVAEATPASYALDGAIGEWTAAPSATLRTARGEAGRVWLAFTESGLVVAGDFDAKAEEGGVVLDKVRVALGFKPPELPAIGFVSHLFTDVVDDTWCRKTAVNQTGGAGTAPSEEERKSCFAWLANCRRLRQAIAERFDRTLTIDLAKGTLALSPLPAGVARAPGSAQGVVGKPDAKGRVSFEALVPPSAFPESGEYPLRTVRVAVRAFSEKSTKPAPAVLAWKTTELSSPRPLHRAAAIMSRIAAHGAASTDGVVDRVAFSYVPASTTSRVTYYFNRGAAGQWMPYLPSPEITDLDVAKGRTLATLPACATPTPAADELCSPGGAITVDAHLVWIDRLFAGHPQAAYVSKRGGVVLDLSEFSASDPYMLVKRAPGVHALSVYQGPSGPFGSGPGGLMTGYSFSITTMDREGNFAPLAEPKLELGIWRDSILGLDTLPGFEGPISSPAVELAIDPKLRSFGFRGTYTVTSTEADGNFLWQPHSFDAGYKWDESAKRYVLFGKSKPVDVDGGP